MAKLLTGTSKMFTLMAVACCVLGLLSVNTAKADPPPCNCGVPPTTSGPEWNSFAMCVWYSCPCATQCGSIAGPGYPGHDAWVACYNSNCNAAVGFNFQSGLCVLRSPCGGTCNSFLGTGCGCANSNGNPDLPCLCL